MPDTVRQDISGKGNIVAGTGDINIGTVIIASASAKKPRLAWEPELVEVPAGTFWMGSAAGEGIPPDETPLHQVELPVFLIGRLPVTNAQYEAFVRLSGHESPKGWELRRPPAGVAEHPVTQVSWHDAAAYCAWLSAQTGRLYRLPTEAEWEKSARSMDARLYPWGNAWRQGCCNCSSNCTTPAAAFPAGASPHGCLDMLGNVQEWTATFWGSSPEQPQFAYPFQQDGRNDLSPVSASLFRIHRGGCFRDQPGSLRCSARGFAAPASKVAWRGFRVLMETD